LAITWKHFPAGENGFFRAPVLLTGTREAVLIDGGFTFADGCKLVDAIKSSGKQLTTIYISQSDPDYYFALAPLRAAFPDARVIAASATVNAIRGSAQKKIEVWGPKLKKNGPQALSDIVIPEAVDSSMIDLEDERIEIIDARGLTNRRYLWVPSLHAIFGGVLVFRDVHVWIADTPTVDARKTWIENLNTLSARKPSIVVAGHLLESSATDASAIAYTREYLTTFEEELARAKDSSELTAAMRERYPNAGMSVALDIGAKVAKGEMKWG
jgi:glyoxylase-like metal-dependent hydrolase (beta-lactamase superfamily II)